MRTFIWGIGILGVFFGFSMGIADQTSATEGFYESSVSPNMSSNQSSAVSEDSSESSMPQIFEVENSEVAAPMPYKCAQTCEGHNMENRFVIEPITEKPDNQCSSACIPLLCQKQECTLSDGAKGKVICGLWRYNADDADYEGNLSIPPYTIQEACQALAA
jgi:hypothetical protein